MALRKILHFPHPNLRIKAEAVTAFNGELQTLLTDMLETLQQHGGVGLAATQIDVHQRVIVIHLGRSHEPLLLINPEILNKQNNLEREEACLSVPGVYGKVTRAAEVSIRYQDQNGNYQELTADGLLGQCIQHEIDHLDGKVYLDYLTPAKRQRLLDQMAKYAREHS